MLCSNIKNIFSPQRNLISLISFPCTGHYHNIFCVLVSKVTAETIDCVAVYVTCDILQLYFVLKFHLNFRSHCIEVAISSECQERVWCIWSIQTPGNTCATKDLITEDVSAHLNDCYKTTDTYMNVAKGNRKFKCTKCASLARHEICPLRHSSRIPLRNGTR